jgi:hypothetical protein
MDTTPLEAALTTLPFISQSTTLNLQDTTHNTTFIATIISLAPPFYFHERSSDSSPYSKILTTIASTTSSMTATPYTTSHIPRAQKPCSTPMTLHKLRLELSNSSRLETYMFPTVVYWLGDGEGIPLMADGRVAKAAAKEMYFGNGWERSGRVEILDLKPSHMHYQSKAGSDEDSLMKDGSNGNRYRNWTGVGT